MLMVWRFLYTLENIIENERIDIGLSELNHLYNLVSNGSHRFPFKHKPQKPHPLLKVTKNDTNWRNQFFFNLDPVVRTFPPRIKDSQEISSTSYTMSSAAKSSKSASRFGVSDIQDIVSPRSIKKELSASQSIPESKGMSNRGKT
ncbi:hypothetical protein Hanom_Chr05g00412361 [Helianthus anomalus]